MVDIIIPTYNQDTHTIRCLKSIRKFTQRSYRILWVDNGSDYESRKRVMLELKEHRYKSIWLAERVGFIKAVNTAISQSDAEYITILNNDTEVTDSWLELLINPLEINSKVAATGPLTTMGTSHQDIIRMQSVLPELKNLSKKHYLNIHSLQKQLCGMFGKKYFVKLEKLAFFCTVFKKEIFEEIGLLDESFQEGYSDDADFSRRVINKGYELALVPAAYVEHYHRKTFSSIYGEQMTSEILQRNRRLLHQKWNTCEKEVQKSESIVKAPAGLSKPIEFYTATEHDKMIAKSCNLFKEMIIIRRIKQSGLFDRRFYLSNNLDVARSCVDPVVHYVRHGWREGRDPSGLFSTKWYLQTYPDVAASGLNPLYHCIMHGKNAKRNPSLIAPARKKSVSDQLNAKKPEPKINEEAALGRIREDNAQKLREKSCNNTEPVLDFGTFRVQPSDFSEFSSNVEVAKIIHVYERSFVGSCALYRIIIPALAMQKYGIESVAIDCYSSLEIFQEYSQKADAAIFHRVPFTSGNTQQFIEAAKNSGLQCIGEIDDLLFPDFIYQLGPVVSQTMTYEKATEMVSAIEKTMSCMDSFIASTQKIADILKDKFKKEVVIYANKIMPHFINNEDEKKSRDIKLIFASGSGTHQGDFAEISHMLQFLLARNTRLHLTVMGPIKVSNLMLSLPNVSQINYVPYKQMFEIYKEHDLMLIPLMRNEFNNAKSFVKYIEAGAVGLPVLASPTDEYLKIIRNGENGFLASNLGEWSNNIDFFLKDKSLLLKAGQKAQRDVAANHTTDSIEESFINFIKKNQKRNR